MVQQHFPHKHVVLVGYSWSAISSPQSVRLFLSSVWANDLVSRSAGLLRVGAYSSVVLPVRHASLMMWKRISTAFWKPELASFLIRWMVGWLSISMVSEACRLTADSSSFTTRLIQSACSRPSFAAMNSAAVLDWAITVCFCDPHAMGAPQSLTT